MDRHDAKPRRPSLLAGAPENAAATPSSARILADMAGHNPAPLDAADGNRHRWLPSLATAVVVIVAGLLVAGLAWRGDFQRGDRSAEDLARQPATQPSPHAASDASMMGPARSLAATIIDDSAAPAADWPETTDSQTRDATDVGETMPGEPSVADPSPFAAIATAIGSRRNTAANPDNPFVAAPPNRPVTSRSRPSSAPPATRSTGDQTDLLAALLRNIQASAEPQPSGLDGLIQRMETTGKADAPRTARADETANRSQQIQSNLRECPAANTAKGLKCRQEICAVYAGRDPACPAM